MRFCPNYFIAPYLANSPVEELRSEKIETLKSTIRPGLVVAETKSLSPVVSQFVPQAVGEMYACAKALKSVPSLNIQFVSLTDHPAAGQMSSVGL